LIFGNTCFNRDSWLYLFMNRLSLVARQFSTSARRTMIIKPVPVLEDK
jgi:predicted ATP-dependent Lon-type protease